MSVSSFISDQSRGCATRINKKEMITAMLEWKLMGERSSKRRRKRWVDVRKEDFNKIKVQK